MVRITYPNFSLPWPWTRCRGSLLSVLGTHSSGKFGLGFLDSPPRDTRVRPSPRSDLSTARSQRNRINPSPAKSYPARLQVTQHLKGTLLNCRIRGANSKNSHSTSVCACNCFFESPLQGRGVDGPSGRGGIFGTSHQKLKKKRAWADGLLSRCCSNVLVEGPHSKDVLDRFYFGLCFALSPIANC
jgi:hypothetical protein